MTLKRKLWHHFKRVLQSRGYEIYKRPYLPKGADAFESLRAHWPDWKPQVIFDVGANVGQSIGRLRPLFPSARIFSFEPVPASYESLKQAAARDTLVQTYPIALGQQPGEAWIHVHDSSDQSSLVTGLIPKTASDEQRIRVQLDTLDHFCAAQNITRIDLLKIDVEGYELPVLMGASALLAKRAVDFIVVEAGLMPGNERFTPLPQLIEMLRPHGFWLVGVYEQYGFRFQQGAEFCNAAFALDNHFTPGSPG